ncbi:MAG: SCO family protein [Gammaproteobacteria bacterium]
MLERSRLAQFALAAVVVGAAFAAGIWLSVRQATVPDGAAVDGLLWPDPPRLRAFELTDASGAPFTLEQLRGRWTLLFFGFTHCPDVCPTTLAELAAASAELRNHPRFGARGQVAFVSVDPARDDAATLAAYVGYFSPEFVAATAAEDELRRLTRALGALFMKVPQGGGEYTMDHSAGIFYISPDLRLVSVLTPPHSRDQIVRRFDAVSAFIEDHG